MRNIKLIVVHCSATPQNWDIGADNIREWHTKHPDDWVFDAPDYIKEWHLERPKKWQDIGYHNVVRRNGVLEHGRDLAISGAHAKGYNKDSIGICLIGGVDVDQNPENNFTDDQMTTLRGYLDTILEIFPNAVLMGHRDLPNVAKACPSFDVRSWYER